MNKGQIIMILLALVIVAGCKQTVELPFYEQGTYGSGETFDPHEDINTNTFSSISELEEWIKSHESSSTYNQPNVFMRGFEVMMDTVSLGKSAGGVMEESASTDFSETNNQVVGVDEADIIKSDGEYIYTVSGKTLFIIKAYPGEDAEIVSKIKLDNRPTSLFVKGDTLAVFGNFQDSDFFKIIGRTPVSGMTFFHIYDISDRESPEIIKDYKLEGSYFEGRMIDGQVYLVTVTAPRYRPMPMPVIYDGVIERKIAPHDIHYFDIPYDSPQFATIHSVDLDNPKDEINAKTVIVEGSQNMYMSEKNIFITYTERINEWEIQQDITIELVEPMLPDQDKERIEKIKAADDDVLSKAEKKQKILQIVQSYIGYLPQEEQDDLQDEIEVTLQEKLEEYEYMEYTIIHKISVYDGEIIVDGTGKVPGHVMNQFSLDEHEDILRMGTTVSSTWSRFGKERTESTNHVFTLDADLEMIDHLADLAESEQIFSTRFIGDRLYMVTFRQVDPFFVIDLSDPENIKELGELKIPGFSRYLHPYDEDTIIGIGRDATSTGRTRGLKISLFDVSDVENPEEVAKFITDERYAQSTAEYEHKAFLFSKEKNMLVIPAYYYDWQNDEAGYNGAMVFHISKDDIEMRGIIDHSDSTANRYGAAVERSLYIENLLYTKSASLLRINEIDDLGSVKNIELKDSNTPYPVY